MKKSYSCSLSEYSLQMFSLVYMLYSLNHSARKGDTYRYVSRYNVKISIYHDTLFVYRYSTLEITLFAPTFYGKGKKKYFLMY